jgi:hypothetical protein
MAAMVLLETGREENEKIADSKMSQTYILLDSVFDTRQAARFIKSSSAWRLSSRISFILGGSASPDKL